MSNKILPFFLFLIISSSVLSTVLDILKLVSKYLLNKLILEQVKEKSLSGKKGGMNIY